MQHATCNMHEDTDRGEEELGAVGVGAGVSHGQQAGPVVQPATLRTIRTIIGYWVGVRRPFHLALFFTVPRMVLPQDPSTDLTSAVRRV